MADYTGLSVKAVGELNYIEYLTYRRDAYIHRLNQSEEGRTYLNNAWRMEQTKPDRNALRKRFGKKEGVNGKQ